MSLYHCCAPQFLSSIQKHGLILGCTPLQIGDKIAFMKETQMRLTLVALLGLMVSGCCDLSVNCQVKKAQANSAEYVRDHRCLKAMRYEGNIVWNSLQGRFVHEPGLVEYHCDQGSISIRDDEVQP